LKNLLKIRSHFPEESLKLKTKIGENESAILWRSIDSSWSGETPGNRNTANVGLFSQYKFTRNLQGRVTLSGLYQGWDKKSGIELSPEIRINETVMLGVKGAVIGGETVITGSIRLELGKPLRAL